MNVDFQAPEYDNLLNMKYDEGSFVTNPDNAMINDNGL